MTIEAFHALARFGYGRRGNEPLPSDPQSWLAGQLDGPDQAQFPPELGSSADGLLMLREQHERKPPPGQSLIEPLARAEEAAQLAVLANPPAPFRERLVWFWANHFTVSMRQGQTRAVIGPYIREAIRPHVTGRFGDMLLAVLRHPAMLIYLDNQTSIGPDSPAGLRTHRGLNENLARECLELHTLGVGGGYSQADVTQFAAILTGWTIDHQAAAPGFVFRPNTHQPGDKILLGRTIPEGEEGGIIALDMLAHHPATMRHLATGLARHFIADAPSPQDVAHLASILADSQGDLAAVSLALTRMPSAWTPGRKFRQPIEFAVALFRALDLPPDQLGAHPGLLRQLGQPLWTAPLPNGWSDQASDWVSSANMLARIDTSYSVVGHALPTLQAEPVQIAAASLGPQLRPQTRLAIANAGDRRDALTLLFSAPEFQRR